VSTPEPTAAPIAIEGFGFTFFEGSTDTISYGVVISNPNATTYAASFVDVNITFFGAGDVIVGSESETLRYILPGQKGAVGGTSFPTGAATRMEVVADGDYEELDFTAGEFTFSGLSTTRDSYSTSTVGTISSTFEEKQEFVEVVVIWRNASGAILGGDFTFVDFVLPDGQVSFEVSSLDPIRGIAATEAYAQP
jgi:hypothetical protein